MVLDAPFVRRLPRPLRGPAAAAALAGLAAGCGGAAPSAVGTPADGVETVPVSAPAGGTTLTIEPASENHSFDIEPARPVPETGGAYDRVRDFESLAEYAKVLVESTFAPAPEMPESVKALDYDDYRLISFWPNEAYWRRAGTPFQLETFHRGYIFFEKVRIHLLSEDGEGRPMTQELPFEEGRYQYRDKLYSSLELPRDFGHAGLKINGTLPSSPYVQEVMSFIGASYFRNLSDGQVYGTSARGLGVDMGMPKPEEFPCFRDFWVVTPPVRDADGDGEFDGPPGTGELTVLAALDSPSLTGAYEFKLRPGQTSEVDVKARLFFRFHPQKLCLAPMSSMWMWGDGRRPPEGEHRPKVHDSDGLLTLDGDDRWAYRPLAKQSYPSVSSFKFEDLKGFGLIQRDRDYEHYRDDEALYHQRPSVWITPGRGEESLGAGHVELFEMPADHEGLDNIACWFVPEGDFRPGDEYDLAYRVSLPSGDPAAHEGGRAVATSVGRGEDGTTVAVRFEGVNAAAPGGPSDQGRPAAGLTARVAAGDGGVEELAVEPDGSAAVTVRFRFRGKDDAPSELRAELFSGGKPAAEAWRYLCPPN